MKILCTGGGGFIGRNLCSALYKAGHSIRSLDNNSRYGQPSTTPSYIDPYYGDIRDLECVMGAVDGCDAIVHLAAINGTGNFYKHPQLVLDVAVRGIVNLLDACKHHGVKQFFLASSSEVYQTPTIIPTPEEVPLVIPDVYNKRYSYAAGKIISEVMLLHSDIFERAIILRPHNIHGPNMGEEHVIPQFIRRAMSMPEGDILKPSTFDIQGNVSDTRAFCYIDNAVSGIMKEIERGEHKNVYNVGVDEELSIGQLAVFICEYFNKCARIRANSKVAGVALGGTKRRCPDITKLRGLGWVPRMSVVDGLNRTIQWYAEHEKINA